MIELLIAIFFAIYVVYHLFLKTPPNFPPGPPSVPILGSVPFLPKMKGVVAFAGDWITERYGKLVGLKLGPYPVVCIYDYELAKEICAKEEASGRPDIFWNNIRMLNKRLGILFNDNNAYRNQRRFIHRTLRDFGFGKASLENILISEADHIVDHFQSLNGRPVQPQLIFNVGVLNVLWKIVADRRYDLTDARMVRLFQMINSTTSLGKQTLLMTFPFLRFLAPQFTGWNQQKEMVRQLHSTMSEILNEHKRTYDKDSMRNLTDVYLKQIQESRDPNFNEEQLTVILMDLFLAGAETTSTTLTWSLINLMQYPEKQKKIHDEIDNILGDEVPNLEYKGRLLYTEAFILETLRHSSIVPMSVPHRAKETFQIRGYTIPKNTIIYPVLRYIMRDPDYWQKPDEFDPERFLTTNKDGKTILSNQEKLIAFGIGKRVCLGESLARQELFLIFIRMLQKFQIIPVEGEEIPKQEDASRGIIHCPPKFNVKFIPRNRAL